MQRRLLKCFITFFWIFNLLVTGDTNFDKNYTVMKFPENWYFKNIQTIGSLFGENFIENTSYVGKKQIIFIYF